MVKPYTTGRGAIMHLSSAWLIIIFNYNLAEEEIKIIDKS
jgi:hypothetical protein